jgi:hypothetical protein
MRSALICLVAVLVTAAVAPAFASPAFEMHSVSVPRTFLGLSISSTTSLLNVSWLSLLPAPSNAPAAHFRLRANTTELEDAAPAAPAFATLADDKYTEPARVRARIISDTSCSGALCTVGIDIFHSMPRPYSDQEGVPAALYEFDFSDSDSQGYLTGLAVMGVGLSVLFAVLTFLFCLGFCCARSCCDCCGQRAATRKYTRGDVLCLKICFGLWLAAMVTITVLTVFLNHATSAGLNKAVDSGDRVALHMSAVATAVGEATTPVQSRISQLNGLSTLLSDIPTSATVNVSNKCFTDYLPAVDVEGVAQAELTNSCTGAKAISGFAPAAAALGPLGSAARALKAARSDIYGQAQTVEQRVATARTSLQGVAPAVAAIDVDTTNTFFDAAAAVGMYTHIGAANGAVLIAADAPASGSTAAGPINVYRQIVTTLFDGRNVQPAQVIAALQGTLPMTSSTTCSATLARLQQISNLYKDVSDLEATTLASEAINAWVRNTFQPAVPALTLTANVTYTQFAGARDVVESNSFTMPVSLRAALDAVALGETSHVPFLTAIIAPLARLRSAMVNVTTINAAYENDVMSFAMNLATENNLNSNALPNRFGSAKTRVDNVPSSLTQASCLRAALTSVEVANRAVAQLPAPLNTSLVPALPQLIAQHADPATGYSTDAFHAALDELSALIVVAQSAVASSAPNEYSDFAQSSQLRSQLEAAPLSFADSLSANLASAATAVSQMKAAALASAYDTHAPVLSDVTSAATRALNLRSAMVNLDTTFSTILSAADNVRDALVATSTHVATAIEAADCTNPNGRFSAIPASARAALTAATGGLQTLVLYANGDDTNDFQRANSALAAYSTDKAALSSAEPTNTKLAAAGLAVGGGYSADLLPANPATQAEDVRRSQTAGVQQPASIAGPFRTQALSLRTAANAAVSAISSAAAIAAPIDSLDPNGSEPARFMPSFGAGLKLIADNAFAPSSLAQPSRTGYPYSPLFASRLSSDDINKLRAYTSAVAEVGGANPGDFSSQVNSLNSAVSAVSDSSVRMQDLIDEYYDARVTVKRDVYVVDEQRLLIVDVFVLVTMLFILVAVGTCLFQKHKPMMMLAMFLFAMSTVIFLLAAVHVAPGMLLSDVCYDVPASVEIVAGGETVNTATFEGVVSFLGETLTQPMRVSDLFNYFVDCRGTAPEVLTIVANASADSPALQEQTLQTYRAQIADALTQSDLTMGAELSAIFASMDTLSTEVVARAHSIADMLQCDATSPLLNGFLNQAACTDFGGAFATLGCLLFLFSICLYPGILLSIMAFKRVNKRNGEDYVPQAAKGKYTKHRPVTLKPGMDASQLKGFTPEAVEAMSTAFTPRPAAPSSPTASRNTPVRSPSSAPLNASIGRSSSGGASSPRSPGTPRNGPGERPSLSVNLNPAYQTQRGQAYQVVGTPSAGAGTPAGYSRNIQPSTPGPQRASMAQRAGVAPPYTPRPNAVEMQSL